MLPGRAGLLANFAGVVVFAGLFAAQYLPAQGNSAQTATPIVRYQFGDDPSGSKGWANPGIDDSAWPIAPQDQWARPAFYSDGFIWVRFSVPVRNDTTGPLSLRVGSMHGTLLAYDVFVNGTHVGSFGTVPPAPVVESVPRDAVFALPIGLTAPGGVAHVALRIWYPPFARSDGAFDSLVLTVDQSRIMHAEEVAARQQALLSNLLPITLNALILLVGFGVLLLAYASRSRNLLLYGAMIFTVPWITIFFEVLEARIFTLSVPEQFLLLVIAQIPAMVVTLEFVWKIYDLKAIWIKRVAQASIAFFNLGILLAYLPVEPSAMVSVARTGFPISLQAFDALTIAIYLWVLFVTRKKRLVAVAMMLVPISSLLSGFRISYRGGPDLVDLAFFLAGLCLCGVLAHQAWKEWRERDVLQTEFETAREMQQRLVPPAVDVPGFRIESVYKPALHVGGDFFYIRPEDEDGILIVVGDVSGKGLKAAMTVSTMIGALRTMPALSPTRVLAALNRGLVGQMQDSFVTCCAARLGHDGKVTIANAGHLPPYENGAEVPVSTGLPLGIDPCAEYEESHFLLSAGSRLTFLSDGIVEARSPSGELFGFERTLQLSNSAAETIAQAAIDFGQEDDITVLTLTRLSVPHRAGLVTPFRSEQLLPAPSVD
ncbi:MAG: PP2C family protein-serine/threonine phosphatase [Terracidiphilus sp.]